MPLVEKLLGRFFSDKEDMEKVKKVIIPSFAIHGVAGVLGLCLMLLLTRTLGAKQYGIYTYSFAVIGLITGICSSSFNLLAVRETSALLSKGKAELWKGFYQWSLKRLIIICVAAACISAGFLWTFTYNFHILKETVYTLPLLYTFIAIPFLGLMSYYTSLLFGQHKTVLALSVDNIAKPLFFLILLVTTISISIHLDAIVTIYLAIASGVLAMLYAFLSFRRKATFSSAPAEYDTRAWKKAMWILIVLTCLGNIIGKLDILSLGYFTNSAVVGVYSGAERVAAAMILFVGITNRIFAASISHLYATGQKEKLQTMITKISRWVTLLSLPLLLTIVVFSHWILSYFGADFVTGQPALIILSAGQIVCIAMGPVGTLSIMTGNEKLNTFFLTGKMTAGILLNVLLVPVMGINGAALASVLTSILWNCAMYIAVKKKTGISTWILG